MSVHNNMNLIAENLKYYAQKYELSILAYVIMPNHIHMILNFKRGSDRIAFMRDFKKFTSTQIRKEIELHEPEMLKKLFYTKGKQKFKIWQDRFDELFIISQDLFETKMQYIHNNPIQEHWSLVEEPEDYLYSSASFYNREEENILPLVHYKDVF